MGRIWWVIPSGIAVIVLIFVGITGLGIPWTPALWMALAVSIAVFLVDFLAVSFFGIRQRSFSQVIPSARLLWFALTTYSLLALAGAVVSVVLPFSLILGVAYQLALLIFLGLAFTVSSSANRQVAVVRQEQSSARSVLMELRAEIAVVSSGIAGFATTHPGIERKWERIGEDVRYLSPSRSAEARSIEENIQTIVRRISAMTAAGSAQMSEAAHIELDDSIKQIGSQLQLRKTILEADDSQGGF